MKILFFGLPFSLGHTYPTLHLVHKLVSKGVEVLYFSTNDLKEIIESTGAIFVEYDIAKLQKKLNNYSVKKNGMRLLTSDYFNKQEKWIKLNLIALEVMKKSIEKYKPDGIIYDEKGSIAAEMIEEQLSIPMICSITKFAFNDDVFAKYSNVFYSKIIQLDTNQYEQEKDIFFNYINSHMFEMKKEKHEYLLSGYGKKNVIYTSKFFQVEGNSFGTSYMFAQPSIRVATTATFLANDKVIYISLGTVNNDNHYFFQKCIQVLSNTEYKVVISVRSQTEVNKFGELPNNIRIYNTVDQIGVLQNAILFITHGGMNSVTEAIMNRVPMIIFPQEGDQFITAKRLEELGAGIVLEESNIYKELIKTITYIIADTSFIENIKVIRKSFVETEDANSISLKIINYFNSKRREII